MRCVVVLQLRGTLQRRSYIREDRIRRRDLREAGVLRLATESRRNQLFEAPDLLQLIEQMEDGQLID
jgi:hypothetical protein